MGREKITVIGAGNVGGTAAQRLAEKDCYDVVLLDIKMPDIDGLDVIARLQELDASVPVIMMRGRKNCPRNRFDWSSIWRGPFWRNVAIVHQWSP